MKTRERKSLLSSCTDTVLSLPHPLPSNAGAGVKQIDHGKPEGLFGRGRLGRVPFESVPEDQSVLETLAKKLVSRSERQIHLKIVGQKEDPVDCRQMREVKQVNGLELVHDTSCPIRENIINCRSVSQPESEVQVRPSVATTSCRRPCQISTVLPVFSRLFSYWTSTSHRMETASRTLVPPSGPIFLLFGNMYRIVVVHVQERPKAGWSGRSSSP